MLHLQTGTFSFVPCCHLCVDAEQGHTDADMFFYLLIVFSTISSLYTLIWDLRMDWGLFDSGAGENTFLREEIVYPHKVECSHTHAHVYTHTYKHLILPHQAYYYCAILEDVILRFAWTIQISLTTMTKLNSSGDIVATVLAPLEVFRWVPITAYWLMPSLRSLLGPQQVE